MIKLAASMAWIKQRTAEYRMTNDEGRRMESLREIFFKIDRIHSFDVRCWTFDVRCSLVSFSIRLAAVQARGGARVKLHYAARAAAAAKGLTL